MRRIGILLNPRAGRGLAPAYAEAIGAALLARGCEPVVRETEKDAIRLPDQIERAIVVGGDGTLRRAAASLGEAGIPFLHAPLGTENLFARMLSLPREPEDIAELAVRGGIRKIDAGRTPFGPFTIMVSVGFDAEVIHDLHARRHGPIRHASYIGPILRTTLKRKWPRVSIEVDGKKVVEQRRGLAIVANFSGYAFGMDPARDAQPDDGQLDAVFLPTSSITRTLLWAWRSRRGVAVDHPAAVVTRGHRVTLSGPDKMALQLDGDAVGLQDSVEITLLPQGYEVIVPSPSLAGSPVETGPTE